ncbi:MAG: type 4a pilus biogenesis protein PilO [Candidatus Sungiibacteriota bacterium]
MSRLTFAIILLVAGAALFIFGVLPAWEDVSAARLEIRKLIRVNDELQAIAKTRDELTEQYNSISQSDLVRLSAVLPQGLDSAQFLRDMEALATRHGLFLKSLDFIKQPTTVTVSASIQLPATRLYAPANVSFNVRGTYESLRAFLVDLEKMIRITDISDITFTAQAAVPKEGVIGPALFEYALKGAIYSSR